MLAELYQSIAPALPLAALFLSLLSLFVSIRNRTDQRQAMLLEKKTELIGLLAQRQSKLGHLELVCLQKLLVLRNHPEEAADPEEESRIHNNLEALRTERRNCDVQITNVRKTNPTDLRSFEGMLATATEFLTLIGGELEVERVTLQELRKQVPRDET